MGDSMKYLETLEELKTALKDAGEETPVFIKFTAKWCGPCKRIQPDFVELSNNYTSAKFYIVDVDENQEAGEYYNISSLPTFVCFKNGASVNKMTGANLQKLTEFLADHGNPSST